MMLFTLCKMGVMMKKIPIEETTQWKNSDKCIATEYPFKDKDIDISTAVITGKYPEHGFCVNTGVKEIIFVIEGSGELHKENESIAFKAGDAILIDKGEKYYWIANCKIVISCTPAWYPEQHLLV